MSTRGSPVLDEDAAAPTPEEYLLQITTVFSPRLLRHDSLLILITKSTVTTRSTLCTGPITVLDARPPTVPYSLVADIDGGNDPQIKKSPAQKPRSTKA